MKVKTLERVHGFVKYIPAAALLFALAASFGVASLQAQETVVPYLAPTAADIARPAWSREFTPKPSDVSALPVAPAEFAALIKRGDVEFDFYDPEVFPREFDGETHFRFFIKYQYRYTYRIRDKDGVRTAFVEPRFSDVDISCNNKIYIPKRFVKGSFWKARLVIHEFEHVRVNCDDRPKLIAERLLEQIDAFEIPLTDEETFSKTRVEERITERVVKIREAITQLLQANNDYLDDLTRHGMRDLKAPESFYQYLYDTERLEKLEFAFFKEIKPLLESDSYLAEDK